MADITKWTSGGRAEIKTHENIREDLEGKDYSTLMNAI
jgi:hypothetical protein